MASSSSSSLSWSYDVFLSFRGEDTRKNFVDHLYKALDDQLIRTYKDDITLLRGESVGPALLKAIEESRHAVIIFSRNYANSSWCLDELVHIMKSRAENGLIVVPIFYDVDPSDVRKQKGEFGKEFAKQEVENVTKAESWRKALVDASNISGWEPKNVANGHEATVIQKIVKAISDKLPSSNYSNIDEELVGMTDRVRDIIMKLEIGTVGVRTVGIWGVGGGGKTTLATSVYMKIKDHFQGHCIVDNIREESRKSDLKKLQENILKEVLKRKVRVQNVDHGKNMIKSGLCHSNVLILLDDVDHLEQLEALAGSHSWFGSGSRIIITTRNKHLLQKVDYISPVKLLSENEGNQLFYKHAYNDKKPLKDYWKLSLRVVNYADGLPLALKVLGSFLYDKDEKEWTSTLNRLPETEIVEKLKISYDGLKTEEKELFLDIACFFKGYIKDDVVEILEASGFHPDIGIKVLIQKALLTIDPRGKFDMHDLIQEMGHYIVRGEHPNNPEKHSRVWKQEEINNMCLGDSTTENYKTEVIYARNINHHPLLYSKIVSNMKKLRWLIVNHSSSVVPDFLSKELRYIKWSDYRGGPFPDSFRPLNLVHLIMYDSLQKELWEGRKHLPHLKVLQLQDMVNLVSTPDFDGLTSLQKLELFNCDKLEEIHPSLGNHKKLKYIRVHCSNLKNFPAIHQIIKLEYLQIYSDHCDFEIPEIQSDMENLAQLFLFGFNMQVGFLSSVAVHCPNLVSLQAKEYDNLYHSGLNHFSKLEFNLLKLSMLVHLDLSFCNWIEKLPEFPSSLVIFVANGCNRLAEIGDVIRNCRWLCQVSVMKGGVLSDGNKLLQSMVQGKARENHSMVLLLEGLQIPREFRPRLRNGTKCTLQLPENWCNDFCGFLMCVVLKDTTMVFSPEITMKQMVRCNGPSPNVSRVRSGSMGIGSQDHVYWEESADDKRTWVGYVSFGSLRHTAAWLDERTSWVSFSMPEYAHRSDLCSGFGVSLVSKKMGSGRKVTSPREYYSEFRKENYDFKPTFLFKDDLTCTSGSGPVRYTPHPVIYTNMRGSFDFKPKFLIEGDLSCTFEIPSIIY